MNSYITENNEHIIFTETPNISTEHYFFPKDTLANIRISGDNNHSEWICQLLGRTLISIQNLYELAVIIQQYYPKNNIDWISQFYTVEMYNYININKEGPFDIGQQNFRKKIDYKKVNKNINNIVITKFKHYGIKF